MAAAPCSGGGHDGSYWLKFSNRREISPLGSLPLEYPDAYDRFASMSVRAVAALNDGFGLNGKIIADRGSGTGRSTFELAKLAQCVIGLDACAPMRDAAVKKARCLGIRNVAFVNGEAEVMPFVECWRAHQDDLVSAVSAWCFSIPASFISNMAFSFLRFWR